MTKQIWLDQTSKQKVIYFSCEELGHIVVRFQNRENKDDKKKKKYKGKKDFKNYKDC